MYKTRGEIVPFIGSTGGGRPLGHGGRAPQDTGGAPRDTVEWVWCNVYEYVFR